MEIFFCLTELNLHTLWLLSEATTEVYHKSRMAAGVVIVLYKCSTVINNLGCTLSN